MKYGLARKISIYDLVSNEGEEFVAAPGAYVQATLWCANHLKGMANEEAEGFYQNYAWVWFGAKQAGLLEKYGMDGELTVDHLNDIANRVTIYIEPVKDGSLPLKGAPSKRK